MKLIMRFATYEELMEGARAHNRERDEVDREAGAPTPLEAGPAPLIRTVIAALEAGLKTESLAPVAEASAMLEEFLQWMCDPERLKARLKEQ